METEIDLSVIPVSALQLRTKEELSSRLNEKKVLCSPDKRYQRDFRGLADCMGLKPMWVKENDHVKGLIEKWSTENLEKANLGKLCEFLERIDRFDVLEDIRDWLDEDARLYLNLNSHLIVWQPSATELVSSGDDFFSLSDQVVFDAFVLYVNADRDFAQTILEYMKIKHLRVCDKNRNLPLGENEFRAIFRFIERCRTLIVIFSNELLQDEICMNVFYFAWNLSNNSNAFLKRVIPCVYKECILPQDVLLLVRLDFTRYEPREFLNTLHRSVARMADASCSDPSCSPNAISFRNRRLEAPYESQSVSNEELELTLLPELADSESNDFNRAPPEPTPLSKRLRSVISLFAPKQRGKAR